MSKIKDKKYLFIGLFLGFLLLFMIFICSFVIKTQTENTDSWVLRSVEDRVVLLNNGEVVEVFGDIVVDTLPQEDKKHLERGIPFLTKDEALIAIEDYDG